MCGYVNLTQRVWIKSGSDSGLLTVITDELGLVDWHGFFLQDLTYALKPQRVVRRNFHG
jgi:hypothetical protein